MTEFVKAISAILPLYSFPAAEEARAPYATYTLSETPIRTKDGIAGYEGTITLTIFATSIAAVDALMIRIIQAIDSKILDGRKMYCADSEISDYPEIGLTSKDLTINILR